MQAGDSNSGDAVYRVTVSILPISIQLTSTHVVFCLIYPPEDGGEFSHAILIGPASHTSVYIESGMIPEPVANGVMFSPESVSRFNLYSIEIGMETFTGPLERKDGIGHRKLELSRIIQMPNFWKPGYTMTMETVLSRGSIQSLISVYSYSMRETPQRKHSNGR
jgi:hypothetical protein